MNSGKCRTQNEERKMKRWLLTICVLPFALFAGSGCRQKMAEMPYYRPYEPSDFFADGRSERPLERGVIHRAQFIETDPFVTGLTREEWERGYALQAKPAVSAPVQTETPIEDRTRTIGAPRFDPRVATNPKVYVDAFPFEMNESDLRRGQDRYTIYCAECHGKYGNGQGKIWERGYLTPTSFHTQKVAPDEVTVSNPRDIPLGYSRGYGLWGIQIPLREVPVGYIYEVVSRGYAGMPSYSAQIPPADRWRIIAYVRVLQMSQHWTNLNELPPDVMKKVNEGGVKP
jgi:mono/diheme cytochrome c family protein